MPNASRLNTQTDEGTLRCDLPRRWFDVWAVLLILFGQGMIVVGVYLQAVRRPEWGSAAALLAGLAVLAGIAVLFAVLYWCLMWERVVVNAGGIRVERHFLLFTISSTIPVDDIQQVDAAYGDVSEDGVHCRQIVIHGIKRKFRVGATLTVAESVQLHQALLQCLNA